MEEFNAAISRHMDVLIARYAEQIQTFEDMGDNIARERLYNWIYSKAVFLAEQDADVLAAFRAAMEQRFRERIIAKAKK